eukprot:SAG31_NODE_169_length_21415_cov_29.765338_4_plen_63_part_00
MTGIRLLNESDFSVELSIHNENDTKIKALFAAIHNEHDAKIMACVAANGPAFVANLRLRTNI